MVEKVNEVGLKMDKKIRVKIVSDDKANVKFEECLLWDCIKLCLVSCVIVLLFGNDFGLDSYFLNFFNFYSSSEIGHDPPCSYAHMTYVYVFLFYVFLFI